MGFWNIKNRPDNYLTEDFFVKNVPINWKSKSGLHILGFIALLHIFWIFFFTVAPGIALIFYLFFFLPILFAIYINQKFLISWLRKLIFAFTRQNKLKKIFNTLPVVDFGDYWFLQETRQDKDFNNIFPDQLGRNKIVDLLILFPASIIAIARILSWLFVENEFFGPPAEFSDVLWLMFLFGPLLFVVIYIPIWVLEDSGFRVVSVAGFSTQKDDVSKTEFNPSEFKERISGVNSLASVFRALVAYPIGLGSFVWLRDNLKVIFPESKDQPVNTNHFDENSIVQVFLNTVSTEFTSYIQVVIVIVILLLFLIGPLYLAVLYYLVKFHGNAVNDFRKEALIYEREYLSKFLEDREPEEVDPLVKRLEKQVKSLLKEKEISYIPKGSILVGDLLSAPLLPLTHDEQKTYLEDLNTILNKEEAKSVKVKTIEYVKKK
ncbi:MAG: hypothetical protein ACXAC7_11000 [Candidatus Hodarchaeales archaeon]|jgi:hypothetical protein